MTKSGLPYQNKGVLTEGSLSAHLIRLTVPMVWGILAIISFQLVDTYYVSLLGTEELAALSFTFPVTYMIFSLIMGFGIATSSVISRLIGEGRDKTVRRVATHALALVFMLGLAMALPGLLFHDAIFRAMGADGAMIVLIREYMLIWFAGAVCVTLPMVGNAAIRARGDTATPALIMTVAALANVVLDPLLIFGLAGFPALGLQGAAIATVLANGCAMIAGLYVLYARERLIDLHSLRRLDLLGDSVHRLLFIAVPAGLTSAVQPFVNAVIIALLASTGTEAVAAFGVVTRIEAFAFIILMALSVGMAPVIGQNWGAGKFARVHETLKLAIGFNVLWSVLVAVLLGLLARPVAGLFSDDPTVIGYATLFFWIVPFSYAFGNLIMGWASAFNAMGMPQRSFAMIVVKMLALMIPAVYLGEYLYGVPGLFAAIAAVNVLSGVAFHVWSWKSCLARESARTGETERQAA